jgi:hypothetical protein
MSLAALGVAGPTRRMMLGSSSSLAGKATSTSTTIATPSVARQQRPVAMMAAARPMPTGLAAASTRRPVLLAARATDDGRTPSTSSPPPPPPSELPRTSVYNTEFGYTRKDIFLLGGGLIGLGCVMYYGLQAIGMDAGMAGNWVQLLIFLGICVGYVSTYVYRVATKQMTYVKQLEQYEEAVMRRRLEEMTEAEVSQMVDEADAERTAREARRAAAAAAAKDAPQP